MESWQVVLYAVSIQELCGFEVFLVKDSLVCAPRQLARTIRKSAGVLFRFQ